MHEAATLDFVMTSDTKSSGDILPGQASKLSYTVEGNRLIDDVDLALESGKKTVIMGANGAGKSVLIRLLHGLLMPTAGSILWAGRPLDLEIRRRQAMVFQRPVLLRRSVLANVQFVLDLAHVQSKASAQEVLEQVGLNRHAARPARQLSGGEQQRLALARALALEPSVLFLDEPSANLDPAATASIETIIDTFHANGTKIVLITHDLGQARRLADEVVFMHHGRILERTPAANFFTAPDSNEASRYLDGKLVL